MRDEPRVLVTDTTMRDAHQSLLATRMRSYDIVAVAEAYATALPQLLSLECWGGATFDVAMRFLTEDPWERLATIRERAPNILLQMLLRGANGVGYTNYPDNVVRFFVARGGGRRHRPFPRVRLPELAGEHARRHGRGVRGRKALRGGDLLYRRHPRSGAGEIRPRAIMSTLARELEKAGAHIIAVKDMAGVMKPAAARALFKALGEDGRRADPFPHARHLGPRRRDGAGGGRGGRRRVDAAMDSLSGLTSQPCLGSLVAALDQTERATGLDLEAIRNISLYWEAVRFQYRAFESDLRSGASEVYLHEMPGGQFTNLKEQARSLGLESRWHEVARAYAEANQLFGDIVKVTPSSKVVGDMALMMVTQELSAADVLDEKRDIAFPDSVVQMMRGELGQPPGGWPEAIQKKALKGAAPIIVRPGSLFAAADLDAERKTAEARIGRPAERARARLLSDVPESLRRLRRRAGGYGPTEVLPTPTYFYGLAAGEEISVELEKGKTLVIRCQAIGEADEDGQVRVFFELNGQPRIARVPDRAHGAAAAPAAKGRAGQCQPRRRADAGRRLRRLGDRRPGGPRRRRAPLHRGDEDGDGAARRPRRHGSRGAGQVGRPDRREGPAAALSGVRPYCAMIFAPVG